MKYWPSIFCLLLVWSCTDRPSLRYHPENYSNGIVAHSISGEPLLASTAYQATVANQDSKRPQQATLSVLNYGEKELSGLKKSYNFPEIIQLLDQQIEQEDQVVLHIEKLKSFLSMRLFDDAYEEIEYIYRFDSLELSTVFFELKYYEGLLHCFDRKYGQALEDFVEAIASAASIDEKIVAIEWAYVAASRNGQMEIAQSLIDDIDGQMNIKSSRDSYKNIMLYKGLISPESIEAQLRYSPHPLQSIQLLFGLYNWYASRNDHVKAKEYLKRIIETKYWPAYVFIDAEVELFYAVPDSN